MASRRNLDSQLKFKICLISGTYPNLPCGIGDYAAKLAVALSDIPGANLAVSVITSNQALKVKNGLITIAPIVPLWNWAGARIVIRYLLAEKPNIVHFQYPTALYGRHPAITLLPLLVRLLSLFMPNWSPVCVLTIHEYATFRPLGKLRILLMILSCQATIGVSLATVDTLRFLRFSGKHLVHIPVAANIATALPEAYKEDPAKWRQEHGVKNDRPVVAYFGFVSPSKGLPLLIKAFNLIEQEAQLLLIAEPKAQDINYQIYFTELDNLIKTKKLTQKVHWTGFVEDKEVAAYLQGATVAVFPYTDGVSLRRTSLLAALANGVPTISTLPQNSEELDKLIDGENIRLIPCENYQVLKEVLEELISDEAQRIKLSKNGQKLATQFNWPEIAIEHLVLFQRLAAN